MPDAAREATIFAATHERVDLDRVWDTIVDDVPSLISSLEQITGL